MAMLQPKILSASQVIVPTQRAIPVSCRGRSFQTTNAKAASPMEPRAAPATSSAADCRPRKVKVIPAFVFFWISCFSSSVAPAGKIAGKARKSPPNARPKCLARTAAMTLMAPPKIKRTVYSDHLFCARRQNGKRLAWASGRTRPNRQEMHKVIVLEPRWLLELREIFPANINWQHTRE
jgi:hypothetical protein